MKRLLIILFVFSAFFGASATKKNYTNSIGMEFVLVPAGSFTRGTPSPVCNCPKDDPFTTKNEYEDCMFKCTSSVSRDEIPAHRVTVSKPFYMGKYEVTQEEWYKVMGNNPAQFKSDIVGQDSRRFPVEYVSYNDVQEFITRLNAKEGGNRYRLPTEAEWEYAAKGGENYKYSGSNNPDAVAWYKGNSKSRTHKVGTKKPNGFGLYDMSGNVWEWVQDIYNEKTYSWMSSLDPVNNDDGYDPIYHGGCFYDSADNLRPAKRNSISKENLFYPNRTYDSSNSKKNSIGFRLLRLVN